MKKEKVFVLIIGMLFISGCAWGDRRPFLGYTPLSAVQPKNNITLRIPPFQDQRTIKDTVGYSRNGYGMRCAKVIPQNSVSEWVTGALRVELENTGYTISDEQNTSNVIEGVIFDMFCDATISYEGRINIKVVLKRDNQAVLDKNYSSNKSGGVNFAATSSSFAKTLELNLQEVIKQVIFDINERLLQKS